MKLSDVPPVEILKLLAYGKSGTGKTCLLAGFPYPMKVYDFDNKMTSAAKFYAGDKERLNGIDVVNCSPSDKIHPIDVFIKDTNEMEKQIEAGTCIYKTVGLDSLTTFSSALLDWLIKKNSGVNRALTKSGAPAIGMKGVANNPGMVDYKLLRSQFLQCIPKMLAWPMNVVMLGHIEEKQDEKSGKIYRGIKLDGKFKEDLPIYFEEVYRTFVKDGKYMAQTQASTMYEARTQRGLPKEIELKYENLIN